MVCTPGLEDITSGELAGLIRTPATIQQLQGGIFFEGDFQDCYVANYRLRSANRVLIRIGTFYATGFPELIRKTSVLDWDRYISANRPISLRVTCKKSKLYHSGAVSDRIQIALEEKLGRPIQIQPFDDHKAQSNQLIVVRIYRDKCLLSIDSSGPGLHRRGYRLASAKAPLREDLAAAVLIASGWDRKSPLVDPFCGSGTLAIEAAMMAAGIPPGFDRNFSFQNWPTFDETLWEQVKQSFDQPQEHMPLFLASDRDAGAIELARENAGRAGVLNLIEFYQKAVSDMTIPEQKGWIVTNPPHGKRVHSNRDLRDLYAAFGKILLNRCSGWYVTVLTGDRKLLTPMSIKFDQSLYFDHGGLTVTAAKGIIE